jgi:hypothetical protein
MNIKRPVIFTGLALSLAISLMVFGVVTTRAASTWYAANTGNDANDCLSPATACQTIQAAVNKATAGDTVNVAAGVYNENVSIPTPLTLNGAKAGVPFGTRTFGSASESKLNGTFTINAPNVTIDGFSITKSVALFAAFGIVVNSSGNEALITNNIIDTVTTADTSGNGTAQGIYLQGGPDDVRIEANKITNIQSNRSAKGVLVGDNGTTNPSERTIIQKNSITNITSTAKGAYGISFANVTPGHTGVEIRDNNINNLTGAWAHGIGLEGDTPGAVVEGNCFSSVVAPGIDRAAVFFEANPSFDTVEVHQNNFNVTPAAFGIAVHPALAAANPTRNVDGTNNWWGSATGPTTPSNPGGTGAQVSSNVIYSPWRIAPPVGGACGGVEATSANQCKNNGWKTVLRSDGTSFKNQGDCMQYVNTGK